MPGRRDPTSVTPTALSKGGHGVSAPPAFSTLSAITELFVTAAVVWFFHQAMRHQRYRFAVMTIALVYETLFNITYMVSRLFEHEEGVTHTHDAWVTWFVAIHGTLSLAMFIGLIWLVVWTGIRYRRGDPHPLGGRGRLVATFLWLWGASILSGELIYIFQWTGIINT